MNTRSLVFWKKIKTLANHAINVLEEPNESNFYK